MLSIAGKIIARIILNRVTQHPLDDVVSESLRLQTKQRDNPGKVPGAESEPVHPADGPGQCL